MPLNWMDVSDVPFDALLLLERVQLGWFRAWNFPEPELCLALAANPKVAWFIRYKCPDMREWVAGELRKAEEITRQSRPLSPETIRRCEVKVLEHIQDLLVYALDPAVYDAQPFLQWDSRELTDLVDFRGKTVLDLGAGTGRLTFIAALRARVVFAVEPVENLRHYLRQEARQRGLTNVYPVDGLIEAIPFPDDFADVVIAGHVFGGDPEAECTEMLRVIRPGGLVVLCPGNGDFDNPTHTCLMDHGYQWARFAQPGDGMKRKYWKIKES